jgi:hypothetical protein
VVTVVIPARDRVDLLARCIDLVRRTVRHEPLEAAHRRQQSTDSERSTTSNTSTGASSTTHIDSTTRAR